MVIPKENLSDLKEKYEAAQKLIEEENQKDTISKSHYDAQSILIEMMENLKNIIQSESNDENLLTYKVILAYVYRDLGKLNVFLEEPSEAEKYLECCLKLIEEYKNKPEVIIPYLGALNEIGVLWSNRENPQKSKVFLEIAEKTYNDFKNLNEIPITLMDVFGTPDEIEKGKGPKEFEKLYTLTAYYMAQVLGHTNDSEQAAKYCHTTLRRQLEANDFEHVDWALNCALLSQYFLESKRFTEARHHLAASTYVINEYETKMMTREISEEEAITQENFNYRYANIARYWSKYGLALLAASKERLMIDDEDDDDSKKLNKVSSKEFLLFPSLKETLSSIENQVTDQYCLTFDDAKSVYHFVIIWLNKAKKYYTADTEATQYARIIMDFAELYKYLAFFEENSSNRSKMHKKRADYLEGLLKLLNKTYYLSICRECWYELALIYGEILNIKLDVLDELKLNEPPTPHAINKINTLCDKAISHLKEFISSYKDKDDNLPDDISKDELQVILQSYFHLGRFFYKIITIDKKLQLNNLQNSYKFYSKFIEDCEKFKEAAEEFKGEVGVCKEMVSLLPLKIKKIMKEINEKN